MALPSNGFLKYAMSLEDETAKLKAVNAELVAALEASYALLCDNSHQWRGRNTIEGQHLLCVLRDAICKATGRDAQDVQDEYALSAKAKS